MRYVLDTNAVIALLKGHEGVITRLRQHRPSDFGLPAIVLHELVFGASKGARSESNRQRLEALQFEVVEFDRDDAWASGVIRAALAEAGTPIGPYDILIAGQALARSLILITRNLREFRRVDGLKVEDWEASPTD